MNMRNSNMDNPMDTPQNSDGRGQAQQQGGAPSAGSSSNGWNQPRSDSWTQGRQQAPYGAQGGPGSPSSFGTQPPQAPSAGQAPYGGSSYGFGQQSQVRQSTAQPYAGQRFAGQQGAGAHVVEPGSEPKNKRKVGMGTALAMMLVVAIAVGGVTGAVVGKAGDDKSSTSTVNEVLERQPVANSTGNEPAAGSVEDVASKVLPSVVSIYSMTRSGGAEGSGSIISPDGYVLTNHHVVAGADQGGRLEVTMNDGSRHSATFVASDATTDVGVIKIDDVSDLPFLQFGDSDAAAVGQEVVAVGSPLGLNATVTSGIVSAKNRPVRASQEGGESSLIDAIQTDAAVNPGNSGGPLVDMEGNIIGMNSMIASLSGGSNAEGGSIGLGFAIPSNFAKRMADELINNGKVKHPTLGVKVRAQSDTLGAEIVDVESGSPADKAGLKSGDVVTRVNDRLIESSDALIAATRSQEFGATVTLEVKGRDNEDVRKVEVTLASE
ncbi:S1C family serine protease [Corynebacterium sp. MSK004]|uniref:S1C family serine protease n=1 Tax=Corynebacterium TaxID=1716 RepID=UPI00254F05CA|nr:trypsin-like peptidase domain-containing protein [Corynebacterium sp. MSK004]MDK8897484.1 trypsin-like peptidase domain-containing protein [Corynebacterium sp. MSK004]